MPPTLTPADALAAWPADAPLAALWASGPATPALLAAPTESHAAADPDDALALLAALAPRLAPDPHAESHAAPFAPGWVVRVSYDLGRALEPAAAGRHRAPDDRRLPLVELHRCEGAHLYDRAATRWHTAGDTRTLPDPRALAAAPRPFDAADPFADLDPAPYTAAVARALDYIRAGDVYQVNLAHRASAPFAGSARALFAALAAAADPHFGVYTEHTAGARRHAICSASPELFLRYDPATRRLTTRPMKGTRPLTSPERDLRDAEKDRAELNMITDLMRNDLGRLADLGSVRVERPRDIEPHGRSVLQATSTVTATLRAGATLADVLAATFPPGSVTGAPKIRAMQLIDELEPFARGPYCGVAGYLADSGAFALNVCIRTATLSGAAAPGARDAIAAGTLDYPIGAGVVADSDPDAEWHETLVKAEVLARALAPSSPVPDGGGVIAPR
ncbi:MAG: anthranilate synthase component I family protein [Phycisphaerales bacterium]